MAKNRQALSDEQIISAIMACGSIRRAAVALQCSPRAIYNRWGSEAFQTAFRAAKAAVLRETVNELAKHSTAAVKVAAGIMNDSEVNPSIRLSACRTILDGLTKMTQILTETDNEIGKTAETVPWNSPYMKNFDNWGSVVND